MSAAATQSEYPQAWTCEPLAGPVNAAISLPGSKSLTNRALVLAALASGPCTLREVLFADDTRHMLENLARVGLAMEVDEASRTVSIDPARSRDFAAEDAELFCGNSGTTIRFLAALLAAAGEATFTLTGIERMKQRPIGALAALLRDLGGNVSFADRGGYPPIVVSGDGGLRGGTVRYDAGGSSSSQYLSAALMVAPYTRHETRVDLQGAQSSWPYVRMTMRLMDVFGVTPETERDQRTQAPAAVVVPRGRYRGTDYRIEPDASAASYFLGLAAIHPGSRITLPGLGGNSLQGDVGFAGVLQKMGARIEQTADATTLVGPDQLDGIDVNLADMPDVAQTLAVVALFAVGETTLRGLHTLRVKETDRIAALQNELTKLGADVEVRGDDAIRITPPTRVRPARIETYDDHRMAMSFALAATRRRGVEIANPGCVAKTFPEFFAVLARVASGN